MNSLPAQANKIADLEVIRGVAATLVIIGHLVEKIPEEVLPRNHVVALFSNWGTEAVMIFFVLSGVVIHASVERTQRGRLRFLADRIVRIHPTLILCVGFSALIEYLVFSGLPKGTTLVSNMLPVSTLQGHLAPVLYNTNPVVWSLSFEVFFYFVFGIFILKSGHVSYKRLFVWLGVSLATLPFYYKQSNFSAAFSYLITMLSFSPIWLVGFLSYKSRYFLPMGRLNALLSLLTLPLVSRLHFSGTFYDPLKYLLFSICAAPLFMFLVSENKKQTPSTINAVSVVQLFIYLLSALMLWRDDSYSAVSKWLYSLLPLLVSLLNIQQVYTILTMVYCSLLKPVFAVIGSMSYSLYLIHYPIIVAVFQLSGLGSFWKVTLAIALFSLTSLAIEKYLQPKISYFVRRNILNKLAGDTTSREATIISGTR